MKLLCFVAVLCLASANPQRDIIRQQLRTSSLKLTDEHAVVETPLEFNVQNGNKGDDDFLLSEEAVYHPGSKDEEVSTEVEYTGKPNVHITAVLVESTDESTKGGKPFITAGGVGQNFVVVKVVSAKGKGHNFTFSVFGRVEP